MRRVPESAAVGGPGNACIVCGRGQMRYDNRSTSTTEQNRTESRSCSFVDQHGAANNKVYVFILLLRQKNSH